MGGSLTRARNFRAASARLGRWACPAQKTLARERNNRTQPDTDTARHTQTHTHRHTQTRSTRLDFHLSSARFL